MVNFRAGQTPSFADVLVLYSQIDHEFELILVFVLAFERAPGPPATVLERVFTPEPASLRIPVD